MSPKGLASLPVGESMMSESVCRWSRCSAEGGSICSSQCQGYKVSLVLPHVCLAKKVLARLLCSLGDAGQRGLECCGLEDARSKQISGQGNGHVSVQCSHTGVVLVEVRWERRDGKVVWRLVVRASRVGV